MKFDGIILDIDGTIWNTTEVVAQAWNKVIEENFPQVKRVSADILKTQFGKTMSEISDNLFPELNADEKKYLMAECCKQEHIFISKNEKNITYSGVVETVKEIVAEKISRLFIVSNCQNGYVELVIEKNGISEAILDFECYGRTGLGKAENIKLLVERNDLKTPVYVGDTQGDFEACENAGVPFIWAEYGFGQINDSDLKKPLFLGKIGTFEELIEIVR